jgi:WD40 repeat protein
VFISYAREDEEFVRRLTAALKAAGRDTWVDWSGIQPTADWMQEVRAAIVGSAAFVFVISPSSARSGVCRKEVEHAVATNKRILPVLHREVDPEELPESIASRNWISIPDGQLSSGVQEIGRVLDTDPEWVSTHTRLLVRATEWEEHERDASFLLRGQDLAQAERWLTDGDERKDPQPTRLQTDLIITSRQVATRSQRARMAVLSVGLIVALALAAYAFIQRERAEDRAREARSRELAATAVAQSKNNPELALLLAIRAADEDTTDEAQSAIRQTLVTSFGRGVLSGHQGSVNSVDFDSAGQLIATGGDDGTARVWNLADRTLRKTIDPGDGIVTDVAMASNGNRLTVGTAKGSVTTWNVATGELVRRLPGMKGAVESVDTSSDGRLVAAAGRDGIRVWGGRSRSPVRADAHRGRVWGVAFSSDGRRLVSAGADGTARIWSVRTGRLLRTLIPGGGTNRIDVNSAEFSPRGGRVVTASDDGTARIWSVGNGHLLTVMSASETSMYSADFSPDGRRVVTGSLDGSARVWFVPQVNSRRTPTRLAHPFATLRGPAGEVNAAAFAPNGRTVATAHSDGSVRLWQAGQKDVTAAIASRGPVTRVVVSPDGSRFATADVDGAVLLRDSDSGVPVSPPIRQKAVVYSVAFGPGGHRLATASGDGRVAIWQPNATPGAALHPSLKLAYGVAFSPDGTRVAAAGIGGGLIWPLEGAAAPIRLDTGGVTLAAIAFAPNGHRLATVGQDGTLRLWDVSSGGQLAAIPAHRGVAYDVAYSPDGRTIATAGGGDRTARLWDADSGHPLRTLSAHSAGVTSVAFSRDGQELVTGSDDRTVRVWDVSSGQLLDTLVGPKDSITSVTYNRDGTQILASSLDRHTYVMRCGICVSFDRLLALARSRVDAALTPEERSRYARELEG